MSQGMRDRFLAIAAQEDEEDKTYQSDLIAHVVQIAQVERRLAPGDHAPDFSLPSHENQIVRMTELLAKGPLLLVFVRGEWCPFCSEQIAALSEAEPTFAAAGIGLAIVTPEIAGRVHSVANSHRVPFPILCDVGMGVALSFGCLYKAPPSAQDYLSRHGIDLVERSGCAGWFIPLAAGFGIGQDGRIVAVFGGADPRDRPEPGDMLVEMKSALASRNGQS